MQLLKSAAQKQINGMRYLLTIALLFFTVVCWAQSDTEKLMLTVKEFHQALVGKNLVSINQQTDKALSYGHSNGWVETKSEMIKNLQSAYISYQGFKEDSMAIVINENIASVRFIADISATLNKVSSIYHLKVLEVWVKKGKRWILFARQAVKGS